MDHQATDTLVLIVEDDPGITELITDVLEFDLGVQTTQASDGVTGLEMAISLTPDLILLDINLPRLSGLVVARRLKASPSTWDIPIIAVTSTPKASCLAAGCDDHIGKPFDLLDLTNRVAASLHRPSPPATLAPA